MHIENVKVGQYVLVVGDNYDGGHPEYDLSYRAPDKTYGGTPYLVKAVNAPFVLTSLNDESFSFDIRRFTLTHCENEYAKEFLRLNKKKIAEEQAKSLAKESEIPKENRCSCPMCGGNMEEVGSEGTVDVIVCQKCGRSMDV